MKRKGLLFDIVVPVYNEEKELEENITKLHSFLKDNFLSTLWHIVIVDNASNDRSLSIAKKLSKRLDNVSFIHLNKKGRGRAVRKVWLESKADIVAYTDIDLSTDLNSLNPMVKKLLDGYDIAIGSRLLSDSVVTNRSFLREIISRMYNVLLKIFFQVRFSDAQCGFKVIKRKVFQSLSSYIENNEWFFDTELLVIAEKIGFKIYEHPVKWQDNPGSTVRVLPTILEDLNGVLRMFAKRPWRSKK